MSTRKLVALRPVAAAALCVALWSPSVAAAEIEVSCDRIAETELEELIARARLLVRAQHVDQTVREVVVECTERATWVLWKSRGGVLRLPVDERLGLVEGTLDAIEATVRRLSTAEPSRPIEPPREAPRAAGVGTPVRQDPEAPGGLGLGVAGEPVGSELVAIGPRLDLGFGSGSISGFATEGFRIGTERDVVLIDTQLGAGWGAPFAPRHAFGFALSVGMEWLSAALAGGGANSGLTDSSVIVSGGVRGRARVGGVALWTGLDLKLRAVPQALGSPIDVEVPRATALLTLGAMLLVAGSEDD